ncbi:MAG: transcription antitermination factor NusB [Fibrobacter sp.]|nr:transcription antitermination factor NusB [Fibrobacter sp.]
MRTSRRQGRVFAMQILYGVEISGNAMGEVITAVINSLKIPKDMQDYGMKLVDLVQEHIAELDAFIVEYAKEWDLERMAVLDKIILRQALVEMLYVEDVPIKVIIVEAVQIATKYSTDDSGGFINGILNSFAQDRQMLGRQN